jgi:hypothetical protein
MSKVYKSANPALLLTFSVVFFLASSAVRWMRDLQMEPLNAIFIPVGLMAYFLPDIVLDEAESVPLKRKLLWVISAAGIIILCAEIWRIRF